MPLLVLVMDFSMKAAIPLSSCTILGYVPTCPVCPVPSHAPSAGVRARCDRVAR